MSEDVWGARDTTPSAIEAALRELLSHRYQEDRAFVPARVMNLVVIVDRGFRGEVENRLARVGRYHPSRLVVAAVESARWRTTTRSIAPSARRIGGGSNVAAIRSRHGVVRSHARSTT